MERRLRRLEEISGPPGETEREREDRRKAVRESALHTNHCHRGEVLPFVIDDDGNVFASRDGKPITDSRQTLAEPWFWEEVEGGGEGLVHDEEGEAFYARTG